MGEKIGGCTFGVVYVIPPESREIATGAPNLSDVKVPQIPTQNHN
jgi:hypothetical protein